jgi:anti-sigma-K factor RskA
MGDSLNRDDYDGDELATLGALRDLGVQDVRFDQPPPGLWAAIDRELSPQPAIAEPSVDVPPRRRRRSLVIAGALVAAAAVIAAVTAVVISRNDSDTVLASAELSSDGLDGAPADARGTAEVVSREGRDELRLDIGNLHPASGEYLEVWLIRPGLDKLVSLGNARPDGTYQLPAGLALNEYSIVDVSTETYDGDPAHSGHSLLRGQLST